MKWTKQELIAELDFKFVRAGGAGGQHVNKVSSKVLLIWDLGNSVLLSAEQKELLRLKLANRINKNAQVLMESDATRSQMQNKELVIQRFLTIVEQALLVEKPRKKTKIPKAKVLARLALKKRTANLKKLRSGRFDD